MNRRTDEDGGGILESFTVEPNVITYVNPWEFTISADRRRNYISNVVMTAMGISRVVSATYSSPTTTIVISDPICLPGMNVMIGPVVPISTSGATVIGNFSNSSYAFDGIISINTNVAINNNYTSTYDAYLGVDFGSGVTKTVYSVRIYSSYGITFNAKLQASSDASSFSDISSVITTIADITGRNEIICTSLGAYRAYRLAIAGNGANSLYVSELEFYGKES
jgi:hypothetical protein